MRKVLLLLITFLFIVTSFGQKTSGTVKGILVDSSSAQPISDATISVIKEKDSSFKSFTRSSYKGNFQINDLNNGTYIIVASYQGLETIRKRFSISPQKIMVDLGALKMVRAYKILKEVIVKDEIPIRVKGDTLVYNADAFKTRPDATVEDLLKKLPGVQVDRNGSVRAQGEQVQKVYVDGKEFFSNDPKLATKNLRADMIDQVQVYNDMSEQAKFNGIDDGSRTKAINLKLKKEKKSGAFGKAYAGYGTDNRYNAGVTANYFKGASQISLIGGVNNINNMGYGESNMNTPGSNDGASGAMGSEDGNTNSSVFGLNYRDTWSKSFDANGSYFFNHSNTINLSQSFRQTFLTDSTLQTNKQTIYNDKNNNHRFNFNIIYTIDSLNSIVFTSNFNVQNSFMFTDDTLTDYIHKNTSGYRADDSRTINNSDSRGYNSMNDLIWRRRFNRRGRTLSVSLSSILNKSETNNYSVIRSKFYNSNELLYRQRNINYKISNNNQTDNNILTLSYTEPFGSNKILELNYSYNSSTNALDKKTYNYNNVTKKYDEVVDTLTNAFENMTNYNRLGVNFRGINKRYNYQFGFAVQQTLLKNNDLSRKINLEQQYTNFLPAASFNYRFTNNKNLQITYHGNNNLPDITQLQNIVDVTDYPYISKGNPRLKPEFVNNLMLTYNSFNTSKLQNLFIYIVYSSTNNKIVNSIYQNAGEQISMPVNLDGAYNISGTFDFGLPIKKMEGGNFNTTTSIDYNHGASLINNSKNYINDLSISEQISLNYNYLEKLYLEISANASYSAVNYTIQKDQNSFYFTFGCSTNSTYTFSNGFTLSTYVEYTKYSGRPNPFVPNHIIWNANLSKQLFKNKRGELKLSVNDILNQNINVSRNTFDNYIEDVQNTTLKRFTMLTFTYKFNNAGNKAAGYKTY